MSTGFKVSSLTCKYVFYRQDIMQRGDPMKLDFEGLVMQK